ncbi:MAG: [protein-PII] uridylyltransferase [Verrucomicrobiota bacterium]
MVTLEDPLYRRVRAHAESRINFLGDDIPERAVRTEAYRNFFRLEQCMVERYHRKGDSGLRVARANAIIYDVLMEMIFKAAEVVVSHSISGWTNRVSLLALGGYGRGEMCPYSDVDILILYPSKAEAPNLSEFEKLFTEEMLYPLWDLGFTVGHSSRNVKQVLEEAAAEPKSKNALLECRFICGNPDPYRQFLKKFRPTYHHKAPLEYIDSQIRVQRERRKKSGDSIYMQEPDIKNGVGGLRDYQNALWMSRIKFDGGDLRTLLRNGILSEERASAFRESYSFLLRVRIDLHFLAKRATDVLTLERQPTVAERLGYPQTDIFERVEAFMKDYYAHAKNILRTASLVEDRILRRKLPIRSDRFRLKDVIASRKYIRAERIDGFLLKEDTLFYESKNVFDQDSIRLVKVFRIAQERGATLHPDLEELIEDKVNLLITGNHWPESLRKCFQSILREAGRVYPTLLKMHQLGVLGRLIPEFGRLTCLVQHEFFHRYTADIHTLNTIRHLDEVFQKSEEPFNYYLKAIRKTETPTLLYLILLLHDIGKADGIRGHDRRGAELAGPILGRMGVPRSLQRQILFIIENHLEMARFWQKFDLDDPVTIQSFAGLMEEESHLCYLYVHTYCDARGTAEGLWNSYKQSLHSMLYLRTLAIFTEERDPELEEQRLRSMVEEDLYSRPIASELSKDELDAHFNLLPDRYFAHNTIGEVELHLRMVHKLLTQIQSAESVGALAPVIDWKKNMELGLTVVNVVTWDRAGLFYKLAGALSVCGLNILSTKAITRTDHIAIDTFYVVGTKGEPVGGDELEKKFEDHVRSALVDGKDLMELIEVEARKSRSGFMPKPATHLPVRFEPVVNVYHELSLKRTIIEVHATDSVGLLYQISKIITEHDFDITFARIATENGVANDTFYIESIKPNEQIDNENLLALRQVLAEAVKNTEAKAS